MSGVWKRSQVRTGKAPPDERGGKQICSGYRYRATLLLYAFRPLIRPFTSVAHAMQEGLAFRLKGSMGVVVRRGERA